MIHPSDELRIVRLFGRKYQWVWLNGRHELHPLIEGNPVRTVTYPPEETP